MSGSYLFVLQLSTFAIQLSLLFGSSVKTRMQYNITRKHEDTHTKTKVLTDQEIPKKPTGCQVMYLLRISYISRPVQCTIFKEVIKIKKEKKGKKVQKQAKEIYIGWNQKSFRDSFSNNKQ